MLNTFLPIYTISFRGHVNRNILQGYPVKSVISFTKLVHLDYIEANSKSKSINHTLHCNN